MIKNACVQIFLQVKSVSIQTDRWTNTLHTAPSRIRPGITGESPGSNMGTVRDFSHDFNVKKGLITVEISTISTEMVDQLPIFQLN